MQSEIQQLEGKRALLAKEKAECKLTLNRRGIRSRSKQKGLKPKSRNGSWGRLGWLTRSAIDKLQRYYVKAVGQNVHKNNITRA